MTRVPTQPTVADPADYLPPIPGAVDWTVPTTTFTAVGYWDDSSSIVLVGICAGRVDFFGGEGVSEGGPWAEGFEVPAGESAEVWIGDRIDEMNGDD